MTPAAMREAIYKGATRPALVLGVPLLPALLVVVLGAVPGAWLAYLHSPWWLAAMAGWVLPLLVAMRFVTRRDDQRVAQVVKLLPLLLRQRNRGLWRCRSYSPVTYRGASDGWL